MRFGLSILVYERKFGELVKKTKDLEKLCLDYVDLATKLALKLGFKIIEVPYPYYIPHEILLSVLDQIKEKIKIFEQISYHTPIKFKSLESMKESIILGKKLGAKKIVIHPYFLSLTPGFKESKPEEILELISLCKKQGLIPCLENLPSEIPIYNRPEEFDFFVKKGAFLTVDTGHAATVNIDPVAFLDRFGDKVKHIHLQDAIVGMPDEHYALGDGDLDYVKFLDKLEEMKFKDFVILEFLSEETAVKSLKILKKINRIR
jgi:sugar phosphate isomerase/epimerase